MSQMTAREYDAHQDFMSRRDAIIAEEKEKTPTHRTARSVWHGYDRPAGTPLVFSQALTDLFREARPDWFLHSLPANAWFVEPNGDILNLWLDEAFVIEVSACQNCQTLIPTDTHSEELGLCVDCSATYFNHICDRCGEEEVHNWDANPFTRYCDKCEP